MRKATLDVVEALVPGGADVNRRDESGRPLFTPPSTSSCQSAVEAGVLRAPFSGGSSAKTRIAATPWSMRFVQKLVLQMVRILIAHRADVKAKDKEGVTLLHCAA